MAELYTMLRACNGCALSAMIRSDAVHLAVRANSCLSQQFRLLPTRV